MQIKKDHIQNAILKAAAQDFLKYGYRKSSMRRMAENAGTRMSNFYNYFKSKDELFSYIVKEQYQLLQKTLRPIAQSDASFTFQNVIDIKILSQELQQWAESLKPLLTVETVLLIACAEGTRFENAREDLIQEFVIIISKLCGGIPDRLQKNKFPLETFIRQLVDELATMVRMDPGAPNIQEIICTRICMFIAGVFIITH